MNKLGIIGGMSWQSTLSYYQFINQGVATASSELTSAPLLIESVNFAEIARMQQQNQWTEAANLLADSAQRLERAGATAIIIATNTMHKVAEPVQAAISIPLLHIADATGQALQGAGIKKVALLGTAFTMTELFYRQRINDQFAIEVLIPLAEQQQRVHEVIYQQLCQGIFCPQAKADYQAIINSLADRGAEAVILGCTEIGLLIKQQDVELPVFDTSAIHAQAAVDFILQPL